VTFPLSSKKMLLLEHKARSRPTFVIPREIVEGINHARAANCEREIYAHVNDKRITKMAREYKDTRPHMTLSGFGPKKYADVVSPRRFNK
jgi:precorrin isomerase